MSYMHVTNLYKDQDILLFKRCYAMEKVHGTSAHISYKDSQLSFFAGGASHVNFVALFNQDELKTKLETMGHPQVTVYGEAYGGKMQGMSNVYGKELRFIAFEVRVGDYWLSVRDAEQVVLGLGLEFVPYEEISTDLAELDRVRDMPSEVALRRGCGNDKPREGVVLRPLVEFTKNNGERVIVKHKQEAFSERATPQKIVDPAKLKVLQEANAVSQEWCTEMRLHHVLQRVPASDMTAVRAVIDAMVEDVYREAKGEIVESKDVQVAIGKRTAQLLKTHLNNQIGKSAD